MIEPIEARGATTETSKLPMNLLFGAPRLLGEEIAFATDEMLDRAQTETHLFGEYLSKMAEAHRASPTLNDLGVILGWRKSFRKDRSRAF